MVIFGEQHKHMSRPNVSLHLMCCNLFVNLKADPHFNILSHIHLSGMQNDNENTHKHLSANMQVNLRHYILY